MHSKYTVQSSQQPTTPCRSTPMPHALAILSTPSTLRPEPPLMSTASAVRSTRSNKTSEARPMSHVHAVPSALSTLTSETSPMPTAHAFPHPESTTIQNTRSLELRPTLTLVRSAPSHATAAHPLHARPSGRRSPGPPRLAGRERRRGGEVEFFFTKGDTDSPTASRARSHRELDRRAPPARPGRARPLLRARLCPGPRQRVSQDLAPAP